MGQILETKRAIQVADIKTALTYADRMRKATLELAGGRTLLSVPMLKDQMAIGVITIYHQEVRPFTDKQIELVQNFAAKPSSRSRTRACSTSCANRCSSRPPPPTCSR